MNVSTDAIRNLFQRIEYLSNCCKVLAIRRPLGNVHRCSSSEKQRQKKKKKNHYVFLFSFKIPDRFLSCDSVFTLQGHFEISMLTSSSCFTRWVCACVSVHKFNSLLWWHSRKHMKRGRKTVTRHLLFTRKNKSDRLTSLTNRKWGEGGKRLPS